jgi:hypothetical protein
MLKDLRGEEKIVFANCYGFFEGMVFLALKMEQLQEGCQKHFGYFMTDVKNMDLTFSSVIPLSLCF